MGFKLRKYRFQTGVGLALGFACASLLAGLTAVRATALRDAQVDAYNVRVGTETFSGLYKFTTNSLLVETAEAITNTGSDVIKFYLGPNTSGESGVTMPPGITSVVKLARDEPNYHKVFDMPFRHFIIWTYPLSVSEPPFTDGNYTTTEQANDYSEMYDLTCYLLTNYNNSGKTFYLGHWEGDGYLKVNNWTTNPSPAVVSAMIAWLNNRQKAVDDAKQATSYTNVNVFNYAEANRVRDAMLNGSNNNIRVINAVIPYVTNLDYLSYSSYDAQDLSAANLNATLDYMHSKLATNKTGVVPEPRMWIGEYGHGSWTTDAQEPFNRGYIQRLLNWSAGGQALKFILYWEIYDNEPDRSFCLIDSNAVKVASWYLQSYFINDARLLAAQFKETHGRLPTDSEFVSLVTPLLNQPIPAPVRFGFDNSSSTLLSSNSAKISGTLTQGLYGDDEAGVWVFYGRQDGGTNSGSWESSRFVGVNSHFNPTVFAATINNLAANTNYYFRFYAANSTGSAWAPASSQFSTSALAPSDFGSRLKITFPGYDRPEALKDFPVLVRLGTNVPGFSYSQFASANGGDLRFTDANGLRLIPHEINQWNTNGISTVWVQIPSLTGTNDAIWAYWGNPLETNPPDYSSNGNVWVPPASDSAPAFDAVYHLEQSGPPYTDSTTQHPASTGTPPAPANGLIGSGCTFTRAPYLDCGTINLGSQFTISAWINVSSSATDIQAVWANGPGGYTSAGLRFYVNDYQTADGALVLATGNGSAGTQLATPTGAVSFNQWHLVTAAVDRNSGAAQLYVDGVLKTSGATRTDFPTNNDVNLARFTDGFFGFKGLMDESRIQQGLASSNWVWASWMNVVSNDTFSGYSEVTQTPPSLVINPTAGGGVTLAWPANGVGFKLESATNLSPPAAWTLATNQPVLVSNQWQILVPGDDGNNRFYRLESQ